MRDINKLILGKIGFEKDINKLKELLTTIYRDSSVSYSLINHAFTTKLLTVSYLPSERNILDVIPKDLIGYLLNFLDVITVERDVRVLNKRWKDTVDDPDICKFRTSITLDVIPGILRGKEKYYYHYVRITGNALRVLSDKYNRVYEINIGDDWHVKSISMFIKDNFGPSMYTNGRRYLTIARK
jgi:hypothetical protein